ncbi:MAG: hypothetical protein AB7G75_20875 [Candidatus Binatia bacterium]
MSCSEAGELRYIDGRLDQECGGLPTHSELAKGLNVNGWGKPWAEAVWFDIVYGGQVQRPEGDCGQTQSTRG